MVSARIKEATALQRKRVVPDSDRTPARDDAADWIEANVVSEDVWPEWTISAIADEAGYSREHISKVLDLYFDPAGQAGSGPLAEALGGAVDAEASADYRAGYRDGFADALDMPDELLRKFIGD